jgi:hypothetical protein
MVSQDVLFHVLTEDRWNYKWLHDSISQQKDKFIQSFDKNVLFANDLFPLNAEGSPKPSGLMYPDLVSTESPTFWKKIRFEKTQSVDQPRLGSIRYCTVRVTLGVDI